MHCLICGKNKSTVIHVFDSKNNPKIKGLKLAKCDNCGFVFINPQPSIEEIKTFYPKDLNVRKRKSKLRFLKEHYEKKRFKLVLKEFEKQTKVPENILDIGCSNGFFLKLAKEKGLEIYGTELNNRQIEYLKKNLTKNIYLSEKELIGKTKFDIITAFDVIEHLPRPDKFIENCSKLLKDDGLLIILTMDLNSWTYRIFKKRVSWIGDQHLFYFSKKTLGKLLEKNGLKIYKTKNYNLSVLHFIQFIRVLILRRKAEFADNIIFFARRN